MKANLVMYAIVDSHNEGFYYDFKESDFTMDFSGQCLLPTRELAKKFIEEELTDNEKAIEVGIESISKAGTWVYSTNEHEVFGS